MGILPVQAGSLPHKSNQIAIVKLHNRNAMSKVVKLASYYCQTLVIIELFNDEA
jgi:hypothetical protein